MIRKKTHIPSYRPHSSGQARVTLTDAATGRSKDYLLGEYGSKESKQEYGRVIQQWEATGRRLLDEATDGLSLNELMVAYMPFVAEHYRRPDGTPTSEQTDIKLSLRPLKKLFGTTRVADFGPMSLKAVRQQMIVDGLARGVVNQRIGRIRRMFKWGVENELVAPSVLHGLQAVAGLQSGRTEAHDTEPIKPVPESIVDKTLPHLSPTLRAMVELQRLTGMRPAEVCLIRAVDIDMSGPIWTYRPASHKTQWRGKERIVCLGPKAQAIVREFLKLQTQAYLFCPKTAAEQLKAERRTKRKSKLWPSHVAHQARKRKRHPSRTPRDRYNTASYRRAIFRACDRAFPPPTNLAQHDDETEAKWLERLTTEQRAELAKWQKENRWHPNRLRHLHATLIRKQFGLEGAQVALGHSRADVTQIYAERNLALAEKIAGEVG